MNAIFNQKLTKETKSKIFVSSGFLLFSPFIHRPANSHAK
jgi:hypothetical protein